jgi:hypothetical protein
MPCLQTTKNTLMQSSGLSLTSRSWSDHKFKIGQLVNYHGRDRAPGVYQVTSYCHRNRRAFEAKAAFGQINWGALIGANKLRAG